MRFESALGLACTLGLAASLSAQTTPTPPTPAQPKPIQPKPIQPVPTGSLPAPLYRMNDVGKTLNLTADQITNLDKVTEQTQNRYRDDIAKLAAMSDADRFAKFQELNQLYAGDWNKGARDIFNDAQRTRYQQLNYQYSGFGALYDPTVQKQLNLTPEQAKDVRTHWDWSAQQLQDVNRAGIADVTKGTKAYQGYWVQRQERIDKFLTAEQQKAWRGLTGEPYTFQPTFTPPPK